ncbi:MAG: hypothetical protein ACO1RT_10290 [Planctomycetaceae bacterium]
MPTSYFSATPIAKFAETPPDDGPVLAVHRVDAPHQVVQDPSLLNGTIEKQTASAAAQGTRDAVDASAFDPAELRTAHTEDLIEFLQQWSEDLDDRAARLNADIATHERRERAFRLWMQNRRQELESQISEYRQAQSRAESIARRLAVGG